MEKAVLFETNPRRSALPLATERTQELTIILSTNMNNIIMIISG